MTTRMYQSFFLNPPFRYEIEYDENRLKIGREIAKRYLGIIFEDSGGGDSNNDRGGNKEQNNSEKENVTNSIVKKNELVVDVLNDDLIDQVRKKITCNYFVFIFNFKIKKNYR